MNGQPRSGGRVKVSKESNWGWRRGATERTPQYDDLPLGNPEMQTSRVEIKDQVGQSHAKAMSKHANACQSPSSRCRAFQTRS